MLRLALVCPVYNDWTSFGILLSNLDQLFDGSGAHIHVYAIDDGSLVSTDITAFPATPNLAKIEIVKLVGNVGHQRAIMIGLCDISERADFDAVVVLDCDGEDQPADILKLLKAYDANPSSIVVAQRVARSEGGMFKFFYSIYKSLFKFMTGQAIDFGNFCLIPKKMLTRLVHLPESWNHLAAAIVRSGMPIVRVPTQRGIRYAGSSNMNFMSLTIHGLGAISVFIETLLMRIFLIVLMAIAIYLLCIATFATYYYWIGPFPVPGWLKTALLISGLILIQLALFAMVAVFVVLSGRTTQKLPPSLFSKNYVDQIIEVK